ncbi:hypothetical protein LQ772_14240 [Frateuria edaphi]|uniref:RelA/SpoT domain-containing protein n=1 Tax=Frateuria edaphi TaxID=2898793 RepID=UPI001E3B3B3F|nr:RelA/SpoT domain-containing protein [Frateuria edaphi]UGB45135.1 hypothetical protein LQ772_14240 [Frateuria edaphi]
MSLQDFLSNHNISTPEWESADCLWDQLLKIRDAFIQQAPNLMENAQFLASAIQKIPAVHSVRWRVKNPDHLIEKIIRKRASKASKYDNIDASNYHTAVTDLVGIRALHLYKADWSTIHRDLVGILELKEKPVAYIRTGDPSELSEAYASAGIDIQEHKQGYRSIHYVFETRPLNRPIVAELQVRTIFEEGWSEIDHSIRYPNFSDDKIVAYFLTIFNRLCGNADEMGSFVRGLKETIDRHKTELHAAQSENARNLEEIDRLLSSLEGLKRQDASSQQTINQLRSQVSELKNRESQTHRYSSLGDILNNLSIQEALDKATGKGYLEAARTAMGVEHLNKLYQLTRGPSEGP